MITRTRAPALDPQLAARLDTGSPALRSLSATQLPAARTELLRAARAITLSDDVERIDVSVPGEHGAPAVVMRIHRPKGLTDPLPCLYAIHGGGYVLGSYEVE